MRQPGIAGPKSPTVQPNAAPRKISPVLPARPPTRSCPLHRVKPFARSSRVTASRTSHTLFRAQRWYYTIRSYCPAPVKEGRISLPPLSQCPLTKSPPMCNEVPPHCRNRGLALSNFETTSFIDATAMTIFPSSLFCTFRSPTRHPRVRDDGPARSTPGPLRSFRES